MDRRTVFMDLKTQRCEDLNCPQLIPRFNTVPIKPNHIRLFIKTDELIFKFILKFQGHKIGKANFKKNKVGRTPLCDCMTCPKAAGPERGPLEVAPLCLPIWINTGKNLTTACSSEPHQPLPSSPRAPQPLSPSVGCLAHHGELWTLIQHQDQGHSQVHLLEMPLSLL